MHTAVNTRQAKAMVQRTLFAHRVPFMTAAPGVGKSAIVKQIADELGLQLIDHRLSTSAPEDLTGLPEFFDNGQNQRRARFVPFGDLFPLEGDPLPEGKSGWLLFLDELSSAAKTVQAAAYKLILDRQVGQYNLHPNVAIVAAGNRMHDRAIVNPIGTALQSRMVHISVEPEFKMWLEDAAIPFGYDSRVISYLAMYPSKLSNFDPSTNPDKTFCCPRTWEIVSDLIKNSPEGALKDELDISLLSGAISAEEAVSFVSFTQVYDNLVKFETILDDPENARIPSDAATMWAVSMSLTEKTDKTNYGIIGRYVNRWEMQYRVLFTRTLLARHPDLYNHPEFGKACRELTRYLNPGN